MTTPDHIGADPALGVGAGQTRRGTPVDLAREVLGRHERHLRDETRHGVTFPMDRGALNLHANAAPTLARQVEAIEALAKRLEWEADPDTHGDHDYGFDDTRNAIAARIRDALQDTDKPA